MARRMGAEGRADTAAAGVCGTVGAAGGAVLRGAFGPVCALAPVTVVAGHYGAGKTNLSLNLALDAARAGAAVTLVDLDVVNPYFRSSEYRALLEEAGVEVVAPVFAEQGSNLDVPSLGGGIAPAIERAYAVADGADGVAARVCLIDAGGDDAGARALGRFAREVGAGPYALWYVVNGLRNLTQDVAEAQQILREIERACRLRATAVVSNAHLKDETDVSTVVAGAAFARRVAEACALPLLCATAPKSLLLRENERVREDLALCDVYPVEAHVRAPWE